MWQGCRTESHSKHVGRVGLQQGRPEVRAQAAQGETRGIDRHQGRGRGHGVGTILVTRPPDPPVPSASLPSESSVSGGAPRLSVLPAPSAPRRGPPWSTPSRRGRISLFTLSASQLPFLGARGHKKG